MYLARGEKCRVARGLRVEAVCRSREEVWQTGIPIGTVICILPLAHDILLVGHRPDWSGFLEVQGAKPPCRGTQVSPASSFSR